MNPLLQLRLYDPAQDAPMIAEWCQAHGYGGMPAHILPALAFIDKARAEQQQARVLVHCVEGVSRSASVVVALLMRDRKLSFDDALKVVQEKRPKAKPNPAFERQLRQLEPVLHQATADRAVPSSSASAAGGVDEPSASD